MIRLELSGEHTRLHSTLCGQCPQGPAGCCVSPPELDWTDIGRIVSLSGRGWLLEQIAAGNLLPASRGLELRRVRKREGPAAPRRSKCVYHGARGCTIPADRRAATCNYFLCEDAFAERVDGQADPASAASRRAHALLREVYGRWDRELAEAIASRPEGPSWDAAFLDWLGAEFERLSSASRGELAALAAPG
ncbi:hypothetical protein [Sorangium cellulosum]|uniref:Zinc/iron-chelating domain-containing protein n=1 Tax=Sorangium cellulosum So0157-2 TaxID=1254432 RepID=S4Y7I9_SORCE|nr:hypothetical protein [Sorangium cellulosum]AGP40366.1 hypothetical protein SCE1572_41220 [Sorangium cellulosum So0157-2]